MLTLECARERLTRDDEAIRRDISVAGRCVLVLLCVESAVAKMPLEDVSRVAINDMYGFLDDCVAFLGGAPISYRKFERHAFSDEQDRGFLFHCQLDPTRESFWALMAGITGWFGAVASDAQTGSSFLCDIDDYDSVSRVLGEAVEESTHVSWKYCAEALRFVTEAFPNRDEDLLEPVQFSEVKARFVRYLATTPE